MIGAQAVPYLVAKPSGRAEPGRPAMATPVYEVTRTKPSLSHIDDIMLLAVFPQGFHQHIPLVQAETVFKEELGFARSIAMSAVQ